MENVSEKSNTQNEKSSELIDVLKQKNSKLTANLKEESEKKNQILSKFNEILANPRQIAKKR